MKKILYLFILLLLMGCSSVEEKKNTLAMEEIERGNYTKAAFLLQEAVVINPDYLDGMVNYRNIYPIAVENTKGKLTLYGKNEDYLREASTYEDMMSLKEGLYNMVPVVHNKLSLSLKIPDYNEIEGLKKDAGVSYYNAGNTFEGLKLDRYKRRKKYFLYSRGEELYSAYLDIVERTSRSLEDARVFVTFMDVKGGVGTSVIRKVDGSALPRIKGSVLDDAKLKRIVTFKELSDTEIKNYLNRAGNLSEKELKSLNTIIRLNVDSFDLRPTRVTQNYYTRTWTERYYVMENNVKVAKYRERTYTEIVYEKRNSSSVTISYDMVDLENGNTIGSGRFEGKSGDRYRWSVIRGRAPVGVMNGVERDIKSDETIINEAILRAAEEMGRDVRNNI